MSDPLYRQELLEHYWNPHNAGVLDHPDASAEDVNVPCGDKIRMDFLISGRRISDVRFSGEGCAISQASASMLTDRLKRTILRQVQGISKKDIIEMLKVPISPARVNCALLGWTVMKKALENHLRRSQ